MITAALATNEPLLLALAPAPAPVARPEVGRDALPAALRDLTIESGSAAAYDVLLKGGSS